MNDPGDFVSNHGFAAGFGEASVRLLKECAVAVRFQREQAIFKEGAVADQFYLITSGCVALEAFVPRRGPMTIQTINAGEALGWSWLFPPYRWHFSATAVEPTEAIGFDASALRERMLRNAELGRDVAMRVGELMLERLQATRVRLLEAYDDRG
jgi:CRP/FNR family cyclic AMP-dependent transcriptional regulator